MIKFERKLTKNGKTDSVSIPKELQKYLSEKPIKRLILEPNTSINGEKIIILKVKEE